MYVITTSNPSIYYINYIHIRLYKNKLFSFVDKNRIYHCHFCDFGKKTVWFIMIKSHSMSFVQLGNDSLGKGYKFSNEFNECFIRFDL